MDTVDKPTSTGMSEPLTLTVRGSPVSPCSICQHTSAYVSLRQHSEKPFCYSAHVFCRLLQHTVQGPEGRGGRSSHEQSPNNSWLAQPAVPHHKTLLLSKTVHLVKVCPAYSKGNWHGVPIGTFEATDDAISLYSKVTQSGPVSWFGDATQISWGPVHEVWVCVCVNNCSERGRNSAGALVGCVCVCVCVCVCRSSPIELAALRPVLWHAIVLDRAPRYYGGQIERERASARTTHMRVYVCKVSIFAVVFVCVCDCVYVMCLFVCLCVLVCKEKIIICSQNLYKKNLLFVQTPYGRHSTMLKIHSRIWDVRVHTLQDK